jgi:heme/copper-type cytochrome/quinol oxidase subunit 2
MNTTLVSEPVSQSGDDQNQRTAPALWRPTAVGALSLIFNPVFGSILILMNWQALGVKEKIRSAQLWLIISIIMLVVVFFIPSPFGTVVSLTYLLVWYLSSAKPQANYIRERWGQAYPQRSWLWPLLIAVMAVATLYGVNFLIGFAQALLSQ